MTTFIALLRGINVGGHRKILMADLCAVCAELGFRDVQSYIQSGNLVFAAAGKAPGVAAKLEQALEQRFGFEVDTIVRTAAEWPRYVEDNPLAKAADKAPNAVMLALAKQPPLASAVSALRARATAGERIEAAGDAIWIHFAGGVANSKLSPSAVDRLVGSPTTMRNWRTVLKLAEMVAAAAGSKRSAH